MRRWIIALCVAVSVTSLAPAAVSANPSPHRRWAVHLEGMWPYRASVGPDRIAFTLSWDGVRALDLDSGSNIWSYPARSDFDQVVLPDGRLAVAGIANVREDGVFRQRLWTRVHDAVTGQVDVETLGPECWGPVIDAHPDGASLFVASACTGEDGSLAVRVFATDARTGEPMWSGELDTPGWDEEAVGIAVGPGGRDVAVIATSCSSQDGPEGSCRGSDPENDPPGFQRWSRAALGVWDARNGALRWDSARPVDPGRRWAGAQVLYAPDGALISREWSPDPLGDASASRLSVREADGATRWEIEGAGRSVLSHDGDMVVVLGHGAGISALELADGHLRWSSPSIGGGILSAGPSSVFLARTVTGVTRDAFPAVWPVGESDIAVFALDDRTGVMRWTARYDGPGSNSIGGARDGVTAIAVDPQGETLVVVGRSSHEASRGTIYLALGYCALEPCALGGQVSPAAGAE